ncbi:MAG: hypothetical protein F4066_00755 [Chloroflexi bacterium]|nr:hypothetical protein [Chloroflexota bacterium]
MFGRAAQINIQPSVITAETVERLRSHDTGLGATLPAWLDALEAAIKAELNLPDSEPEDDPGAGTSDWSSAQRRPGAPRRAEP